MTSTPEMTISLDLQHSLHYGDGLVDWADKSITEIMISRFSEMSKRCDTEQVTRTQQLSRTGAHRIAAALPDKR
jgi:hypothetical protein